MGSKVSFTNTTLVMAYPEIKFYNIIEEVGGRIQRAIHQRLATLSWQLLSKLGRKDRYHNHTLVVLLQIS